MASAKNRNPGKTTVPAVIANEQPIIEGKVEPAREDAATPAPDTKAVEARTIRGVRKWLQGCFGAFWIGVFLVVLSQVDSYRKDLHLPGLFAILAAIIITPMTFLFTILEPAVFADRSTRRWIVACCGNYVILTLLFWYIHMISVTLDILSIGMFALSAVMMVSAIYLLVVALRRNKRVLFIASFLLLLLANYHTLLWK
ncbi:MAG: hypothetical protein ACYDBB_17520 [Armatimonadota bacterium]